MRDLGCTPTLRGLCAGYEGGKWRTHELARHALAWLTEFALDYSDYKSIAGHNHTEMLAKAAAAVYTSDKYKRRGEFGEIFLHAILRQECGSLPAISKVYFKSATNDTVKGFDAVHVVGSPGDLELWLGEAKFYSNINDAVRAVANDLTAHTEHHYLREEFLLIDNKLDPHWPHAAELKPLLHRNTSLDTVFKRLCFPVLITYDSDCIATHTACDVPYLAAFEKEIRQHHAALVAAGLPPSLRIHLFLFPVHNKAALATALDEGLKTCQRV